MRASERVAHLLGACELSRPIPALASTQARCIQLVDRGVVARAVAAHLRRAAGARAAACQSRLPRVVAAWPSTVNRVGSAKAALGI